MKTKQYASKLLFIFGLLAFLVSCRPTIDLTRPEDTLVDYRSKGVVDFGIEFQNFWSGMNHNYLYWDVDPTDWDAVYDIYKPKFDELGTLPEGDIAPDNPKVRKAVDYMNELSKDLVDGHLTIVYHDNIMWGPGLNVQPADVRARKRDNFTDYDTVFFAPSRADPRPSRADPSLGSVSFDGDGFPWSTAITGILDQDAPLFVGAPSASDGPGVINIILGKKTISGTDFIAYFYFNSFDFISNMQKRNDEVNEIINTLFDDYIKDPGLKGVIFDLRGNGGGAAQDVAMFLSPFIDEPLVIGQLRTKNGIGRLDYAPWGPFLVTPSKEYRVNNLNMPVVALVNEFSISCGEFLPMGIRQLRNGHIIGKRTHGGTGPRISDFDDRVLNGGGFKSGIFINSVLQAAFAARAAGGENLEGIGISPDLELPFGAAEWAQFYGGEDPWLLRAIDYVKNHLP
ncbi:hypothetical protein AGMMS49546_10690 [Spirochaetia bacterium]|nr:hypothetical protein AGMMS49546_10690 [Spirochaetia bacterium]